MPNVQDKLHTAILHLQLASPASKLPTAPIRVNAPLTLVPQIHALTQMWRMEMHAQAATAVQALATPLLETQTTQPTVEPVHHVMAQAGNTQLQILAIFAVDSHVGNVQQDYALPMMLLDAAQAKHALQEHV